MKYRVELFVGACRLSTGFCRDHNCGDREFYWRIRHRNGNKLCSSEGYEHKSTALRIARRLAKAFSLELRDLTKPKR